MFSFKTIFPYIFWFSLAIIGERVFSAEIGEPCETDADCLSGASGNLSHCSSSRCDCNWNTVREPGEDPVVCRKLAVGIGDPCEVQLQCNAVIALGPFSECTIDGVCACKENAVENIFSGYSCVLKIGQPCNTSRDCTGASVKCTGRCDCERYYTASNQLADCLPIQSSFGGSCTQNQQCQKGSLGPLSICDDRKCRCQDDSVLPSNSISCYQAAISVYEDCEYDAQCIANLEHALCLNKMCMCMDGFLPSMNRSKCIRAKDDL